MNKRPLVCVVLLILLGCAESGGWPKLAAEPSANQTPKCGCLIVALQGKTYVKPANSGKYALAKPRMPVFEGDLLRVAESSKATLNCGQGSTELSSGIHPVPCKSGPGTPIEFGNRIVDTGGIRSPRNPSFPRLLSPRKTMLLDAHPNLRWTTVTNATRYAVRVRGMNVDWSTSVTSTETVYPDDAPALVAGQKYRVTIFAGDRNSDDERVLGLDFEVLDAQTAEKVKAREKEIKSLNLEETSKRLLIAYLYASHNLNAEAIMQLDEASVDQEEVRILAEVYLRIKLFDRAEAQYLRTVELSDGNELVRAFAYDRLGQISEVLGKKEQAIQKYESAIGLYVGLGNWFKMREIGSRLEELQKP